VNVEMPIIKKGSKGGFVKTLQRLLVALGYSCGSSGIDGDFGSATDKAVRAYQKKKNLGVDGIVGKNTWGSILQGE
jgi:peptidoglycan hydrolase-like protein with peptidoglycan-binding domain